MLWIKNAIGYDRPSAFWGEKSMYFQIEDITFTLAEQTETGLSTRTAIKEILNLELLQ